MAQFRDGAPRETARLASGSVSSASSAHSFDDPPLLVFDLDGTISDPAVGMCRSINYALAAFGYPEIDEPEVHQHIGPPLDLTFRRIAGGAPEITILGMVAKYRERYGDVGYAENRVYPGIAEALAHLASHGVEIGLCTAKRVDFAERILSLFGLREYFAFVSGGDVGVAKEQQLRLLLEHRTIAPGAVMIGDRAGDIAAARHNGLRSIGVLWGYGDRDELRQAGADLLIESPLELRRLAGVR